MSGFVGTQERLSPKQLHTLITDITHPNRYCFLRWAHQVSGFTDVLPTNPGTLSPEGHVFDCDRELRWKQRGDRYSILLLSRQDKQPEDFDPVPGQWMTEDHSAHLYPSTETRFPKGFAEFTEPAEKIKQRYFLDQDTGTVHFVALTLGKTP